MRLKVFREIKYRWQRGKRGFADCDVWNIDMYLGKLVPNMLDELARITNCFPTGDDWPTYEDWITEIRAMAEMIRVANSEEEDDFVKWCGRVCRPEFQVQKFSHWYTVDTDERTRILSIPNENQRRAEEHELLKKMIFARLPILWDHLWD